MSTFKVVPSLPEEYRLEPREHARLVVVLQAPTAPTDDYLCRLSADADDVSVRGQSDFFIPKDDWADIPNPEYQDWVDIYGPPTAAEGDPDAPPPPPS